MDGLNKKVISNNIVQQAVDAMDISSDSYSPEQAEKLLVVHKRVMEPEAHTFTAAAVNEAAGTTYLATAKDGSVVSYPETATFDQIIELTGKGSLNESDMTAAIRINNRREAQGFPPADSFTFEEASKVLSPDQMQDLVGISVKARTESEVYRPVTLRNKKGKVSYAVETSAGEQVTGRPSTEKELAAIKASVTKSIAGESNEFRLGLEKMKEDRKDERVGLQTEDQSKLISQRQGKRGEVTKLKETGNVLLDISRKVINEQQNGEEGQS